MTRRPSNETRPTIPSYHFESEIGPKDAETDDYMNNSLSIPLLATKKHFCLCIPAEWVVLPPDGKEVKISNSSLSTVFLILNTMIGSGILVQPYVFQQSGIVAAIFEYMIILVMIFLGSEMIIKCGECVKIYDYSDAVANILGERFSIVLDVAIVVNGVGSTLSYIIIIGSLFTSVVDLSNCDAWYCNEGFLTILPVLSFTVPLCLIRRFGHLALISYASIFVIGSVMLLVLIGGPIRREYYVDDDTAVATGSFVGCIATVGDIVFALGYITAIFHTYNAHHTKNADAYTAIVLKTTVIGAFMCFFTGLAGYLSFRSNTDTNILENFPGTIGAIFKIAVIFHLILYIPGDFVILRAALWKLFKTDVAKQSDVSFISVTLALILGITGIAIILMLTIGNSDALGLVVNLTGGFSGSVLYFMLPGYCTLKLFPTEVIAYRKGMSLLVFGIIIFILVFVSVLI
jgi:sodium-coupled neutral amino acid transporter 11